MGDLSVSHPTSFYMCHKLLSFLEEALKDGELLEGIVETDEAYVLESHADYNKAYHLNAVNGLHARLKAMLYRCRGVSNKYLNRYIALFTVLEQAGCSVFQPEVDSIRQPVPV